MSRSSGERRELRSRYTSHAYQPAPPTMASRTSTTVLTPPRRERAGGRNRGVEAEDMAGGGQKGGGQKGDGQKGDGLRGDGLRGDGLNRKTAHQPSSRIASDFTPQRRAVR